MLIESDGPSRPWSGRRRPRLHQLLANRQITKLELIGSGRPQPASGGAPESTDCQFRSGTARINEHSNRWPTQVGHSGAGPETCDYCTFLANGENPKLELIEFSADSPESAWRASRLARLLSGISWKGSMKYQGLGAPRIPRSGVGGPADRPDCCGEPWGPASDG